MASARRELIRQSMALAGALCLLKTAAGVASGSLGILTSALDSLMDLFASAVNYVSLAIAQSPADEEHPYGHGKAEAMASLFQGSFIALGGAAVLFEAGRRFLSGQGLEFHAYGAAVMVLSMVASAVHGARLKRSARRSESQIMASESAHFLSDVASNGGVIAALFLVRSTGSPLWDLGVSVLVSAYILAVSVPILRRSVSELMDEGLPPVDLAEVEKIINGHHPNIVGFHDFRSRRAGDRRYIEFHIEIRGVTDFRKAHDIAESLTQKIKRQVSNSDVIIHYDPEGAM